MFGKHDPITIKPYRGYSTATQLYMRGRVLEQEEHAAPEIDDSAWENLASAWRQFESDEVAGARLRARYGGETREIVTDREGYFEVELPIAAPPPPDAVWHEVELELLHPAVEPRVSVVGKALVQRPAARFGVISDIDDTVVQTEATSLRGMIRSVLLSNARTRLPFPGVAALYRALYRGVGGNEGNPQFFVSSSPWNLYDGLSLFFSVNGIADEPVLFLRDWGITRATLPFGHRTHKLASIRRIMDSFHSLPFILIGDSGQHDPEIYHEVVRDYPGRILAVYIRNIDRQPARLEAIKRLADEVLAAGSSLVLSDDTLAAARHAVQQGWIAGADIPEIAAEKTADKEAAAPAPTVVVTPDQAQVATSEQPTTVAPGGAGSAVAQALEGEPSEQPTVIAKREGGQPL